MNRLLVVLIALIPITLLRGWVLKMLWLWFMVPIFGLPALSGVAAYGVATTVSAIIGPIGYNGRKFSEADILATSALYSVVCLIMGWVAHLLM